MVAAEVVKMLLKEKLISADFDKLYYGKRWVENHPLFLLQKSLPQNSLCGIII